MAKKNKTEIDEMIKALKRKDIQASILVLVNNDGTISIGYSNLDDMDSAKVLQISADLMNDMSGNPSIH